MAERDFSTMSNEDIKITLKNLENEFESKKLKIKTLMEDMEKLDSDYIKGKNELSKRFKGIVG